MQAESDIRTRVIKLGGSILTGPQAYADCAAWLCERREQDPQHRFVVVVSAQLGTTDALLKQSQQIMPEPDAAALDLLWSTGELQSVALLTLHLQRMGVAAVGLNAHECGLISPAGQRDAHAIRINTLHLRYRLTRHPVVVVPGFLARGPFDTVVTLGRGGSDLTAVLLAAGLRADCCELIKDVPGYFDKDPNRFSDAAPLAALGYGEALRMAAAGCDLVQTAAIEAAARTDTPLIVRSMSERSAHTVVSDKGSAVTALRARGAQAAG